MKKIFTVLLVVMLCAFPVASFAAVAAEAEAVNYYDENGNLITMGGLYYNDQGFPTFNSNCYYYDADGNAVYVGGCRAYFADGEGGYMPCGYYYDADGSIVTPPYAYGGGRGGCCGGGRWR